MTREYHDLPVSDPSITTIAEWRDAIENYLEEMYGMRLLCEINPITGSRFKHLDETFSGSSSTIADRKHEALELGLIEVDVRMSESGYGTHIYYTLTQVGGHYRKELAKRGLVEVHHRLNPLEQQFKSARSSIDNNGLDLSIDPLELFYSDHE